MIKITPSLATCEITLKACKVSRSQSEETTAFRSDLWFRGKKLAHASNSGRGEMTLVHFYCDKQLAEQAEAYAATFELDFEGRKRALTLDELADSLAERHDFAQELKRKLSSRTVLAHDGKILQTKGLLDQAGLNRIEQSHPGCKILNSLSFEDALEIYMQT